METQSKKDDLNANLGQLMEALHLPDSFRQGIDAVYLPLASIIVEKAKKADTAFFVSINGSQGSGKSTLVQFLKKIIEARYGMTVAIISIDDFYLTRKTRKGLSMLVHPLFVTRGVPGTHDLQLMEDTIGYLIAQKEVVLPVFDKALDDRLEKSAWKKQQPAQIILFEGWCNNSPAQSDEELIEPVNQLEREEDPHRIWRTHANEMLKIYHQRIFSKTDMNIMLQIPGFEYVYQWRKKQEEKLAMSVKDKSIKVMDDNQLSRFIQHYERITRHTLGNMAEQIADVVIPINAQQVLTEIQVPHGD